MLLTTASSLSFWAVTVTMQGICSCWQGDCIQSWQRYITTGISARGNTWQWKLTYMHGWESSEKIEIHSSLGAQPCLVLLTITIIAKYPFSMVFRTLQFETKTTRWMQDIVCQVWASHIHFSYWGDNALQKRNCTMNIILVIWDMQ